MDILEALSAAPVRGNKLCVIQKWIDTIPEDTAGREALIAILTTTDTRSADYRPRGQTVGILARLGFETSENAVGDHRSGTRCRCFR